VNSPLGESVHTVSSGQDPVFADKGATAEILAVQVETSLVRELSFCSRFAADNSTFIISNGLSEYWDGEFVG